MATVEGNSQSDRSTENKMKNFNKEYPDWKRYSINHFWYYKLRYWKHRFNSKKKSYEFNTIGK